MSPQYGELRPTSGWDRLTSLGYPCKFQLVSHLGMQRYCTASSSGRQPNFAALNRGHHLYSAGRPSGWALAHISSFFCFTFLTCVVMCSLYIVLWCLQCYYISIWHQSIFLINCLSLKDIDQLKKTMALTGTPGPTLLAKITSEEVLICCCMRLTLWNEELIVHLSLQH